jgi:hypothetical protein
MNPADLSEHGGFLVALAEAMGDVMDQDLEKLEAATEQLSELPSGEPGYGALTAEIQAMGQELSLLSQATSNVVSSIGDALTVLARKG